ncbi:hypothetical protein ACLB2K_055051 [Fragaria x ananassa]
MWVRWRKGRWWRDRDGRGGGVCGGGGRSGCDEVEAGEEGLEGRVAVDEGGEKVGAIFDDGAEGEDEKGEEEEERIVLEYFGELFQSSCPSNLDVLTDLFSAVVTHDMNAVLTREFETAKVFQTLKQMQPLKASGPDGFAPYVYQKFWSLVGEGVTRAVRCFMDSESLMRQVNCTNVTLISKVKTLENMQQLRPISLCHVIYKLGSKVLSPNQCVFVPGRQISDNSLLAFEISHFRKRCFGGGQGYGALKLDMSKAYDRVEWPFLEAMMVLLAKQGWRILKEPNSLLARVLKAKYYPNSNFLKASVKPGDSYAWKSLMKGKQVLVNGSRYLVVSGTSISVWNDPWLPRLYTFKPCLPVMEGLEDLVVADLIDEDSRSWSLEWLEEFITREEVDMIRRIPFSARRGQMC